MTKFYYYAGSIATIVIGFIILLDPVIDDPVFEYTFDLTEIRWPFGLFFFCSGLLLLYRSIKSKYDENDDYRKCPECMKTYHKDTVEDNICPECGAQVEELRGFYDRYTGTDSK